MNASTIIDNAVIEQVGRGYLGYADPIKRAVARAEASGDSILDAFDSGVRQARIPSAYDEVVSIVRAKVEESLTSATPTEADPREHAANVLLAFASTKGANMAAVNTALTQAGLIVPEFDRAQAALVVHQTANRMGVSDAEITPVLIEAGLVDAPEPTPEVEPEPVDSGVFARLVAFAKRHGFTG